MTRGRLTYDAREGLMEKAVIEMQTELRKMGYNARVEPFLFEGEPDTSGLVVHVHGRKIVDYEAIANRARTSIRHMLGKQHADVTSDIEAYPDETVITFYEALIL